MLNFNMMPMRTHQLFELLSTEEALRGVNLIGGTALSIQLSHRLSEDLDFFVHADKLDSRSLDEMINRLSQNHKVNLMTTASQISQAKINGVNLLSQARDYMIDGVKVTFFARNDAPYQHFATLNKVPSPATFNIASASTVFSMKSWLLQKRVKSRDLYDLMRYLKDTKTPITAIFKEAHKADPANYSEELIKQVLIGGVPLDHDDEGFTSIGLQMDITHIRKYFEEAINAHEIDLAQSAANQHTQARPS